MGLPSTIPILGGYFLDAAEFQKNYDLLNPENQARIRRKIDALHRNNEEVIYGVWRETLDECGTDDMPDKFLENKYIRRYLAEKES